MVLTAWLSPLMRGQDQAFYRGHHLPFEDELALGVGDLAQVDLDVGGVQSDGVALPVFTEFQCLLIVEGYGGAGNGLAVFIEYDAVDDGAGIEHMYGGGGSGFRRIRFCRFQRRGAGWLGDFHTCFERRVFLDREGARGGDVLCRVGTV